MSFIELLSTHLLICNERIEGQGEDSSFASYTEESGIMGAFDGCGGLGSKTCFSISEKTEAYLASRAVSNAVRLWFRYNAETGYSWDRDLLKSMILESLTLVQKHETEPGLRMRGSLVRPFPTTMAVITLQEEQGRLVTDHIWAGDSRTYLLDREGISQVSVDDIKGEDALENLTKDGALTNVISVDGRFQLHHARLEPMCPCIMICASDGSFGYVTSPMEFEALILAALLKSRNVEEWKDRLSREIAARAGDDQTLVLAAFGFDSFAQMQAYYQRREREVSAIAKEFRNSDYKRRLELWQEYKPGYYRYSAGKTE